MAKALVFMAAALILVGGFVGTLETASAEACCPTVPDDSTPSTAVTKPDPGNPCRPQCDETT